MSKLVTIVFTVFALASVTALALAQGETLQVGVGTPVVWTYEGTPVATVNGVAILETNGPFRFEPKELDVAVGETVVWTNAGSSSHTVTANDGSFDSGLDDTIDGGETYSHTFTTAGDVTYHCAIHPAMTGTIHVK